jgi:pyridine nucleotide-disulfide oxidoreductase family protein
MTKRIVLAGGGHAHLSVLEDWVNRPSDAQDRVLIMPTENSAYSGMLPGWMAGIYSQPSVFIPVARLARRAGVRVIVASVVGLDADAKQLTLSSGETLEFDIASLATGGDVPEAGFEGSAERVLSVRPVEQFVQGWSEFTSDAADIDSPHIVIIGGGAGGVELAFAARARMQLVNKSAKVSLVTPADGFLAGHSHKVRSLAQAALEARGVQLHWSMATANAGGVVLDDGTVLTPDAVLLATGSKPQSWLVASGLACTDDGYVCVGPTLQSASHPDIFAAGDIIERSDRQMERSGVHAVKAGPVLAHNLLARLDGRDLETYDARGTTLYLLATGDRRAILSWGKFSTMGRWPWWLKERIDRGFVDRYTRLAQ